jgi:peroxiredoxin
MPLSPGEPAPWFTAPTPSNPEFVFDTVAGRFVLLAFLPAQDPAASGAALKMLSENQRLFDDRRLSAFVVVRDPGMAAGLRDMRGLRWFLDFEGAVSRLYDAVEADGTERPFWMLLDPALRVIGQSPLAEPAKMFAFLAGLPAPGEHAGTPLHAPVLIAPRVLEPAMCQTLIDLHQATGGRFSGVMRDAGDRTVAVMDDLKKRRDVLVDDPDLQAALRERLERRLFPLIKRGLGSDATHIERYVVSCYDAADGAVFHPHRDHTTMGTAHRKFACSINLNSDFEGGDLRFAEFGATTYRPPEGGAVVFSCGLLHEVTPMTAGRRYAFLPFFYDEAGAEVLQAYRTRIAATPPPG